MSGGSSEPLISFKIGANLYYFGHFPIIFPPKNTKKTHKKHKKTHKKMKKMKKNVKKHGLMELLLEI